MNQKTFGFPHIVNRITDSITLSDNTKSINECLSILLRTRPGEMLGDPDWGCNLISRVFQYQGVIVESLIREDITSAIEKYEPRISMDSNDIIIDTDGNTVHIYINYTIKETGEVNQYNMDITSDDNPDKI